MLSEGVQLYGADPRGAVAWFAHGLHYPYEPAADGAPSDWLMDLVSVGFAKPNGFAPRRACSRARMHRLCAVPAFCVVRGLQQKHRMQNQMDRHVLFKKNMKDHTGFFFLREYNGGTLQT